MSDEIRDILWGLRKYSGNECLLMSTIFVCCKTDYPRNKRLLDVLTEEEFDVYRVYRIRKCSIGGNYTKNCCALFVDELGRVYDNWKEFKSDQKFRVDVMVAPRDGIYMERADKNEVDLEGVRYAANGIVEAVDIGSSCVGLAAAGVTIVSVIPAVTLAPAFLLGAGLVVISCAAYAGVRSIINLVDRGSHRQTINPFKNGEARGAWINIAGGVACAGAVGVTQALSIAAARGVDIPKCVAGTVNVINVCPIALNAIATIDGLVTVITKVIDDEEISALSILQLSTSFVMFTHSVYNFRTAEVIITQNRVGVFGRIRNMFTEQSQTSLKQLVEITRQNKGIGNRSISRIFGSMGPEELSDSGISKLKTILNDDMIKLCFKAGITFASCYGGRRKMEDETLSEISKKFTQRNLEKFLDFVNDCSWTSTTL